MPDSKSMTMGDAGIRETNPDTVYQSETSHMLIGASGTTRKYLFLLLDSLNAEIQEGLLKIHISDWGGIESFDINIYACTSSWSPGSVTWNNQPTYGSLLDSATVTQTPDDLEFDITELMKAWDDSPSTAYGIMLEITNIVDYAQIDALDHGTANNRPYLEWTLATVPSVPQSLTVDANESCVHLDWTAPADEGGRDISGYNIYRGTVSGSLSLLTSVTTAYYSDTSAVRGITYYYQVGAVNEIGESTLTSEVSDAREDKVVGVLPDQHFRTEIGVKTKTGVDSTNKPTYSDPVTHNGRLQHGNQMITSPSGEVIMSKCKIYFDGSMTINPQDVVVLPDSEELTVIQVDEKKGPTGTTWLKVVYT